MVQKIQTIERGNIYFAYRPALPEEKAAKLEDVGRFSVIINPRGTKTYRLIVVGRKTLPQNRGTARARAFVESVFQSPEELKHELDSQIYETKTAGRRTLPQAHLAGEGVYSIVLHDDHTHLAYVLELPYTMGEVQKEFNLEKEASYVIAVKNPRASSPLGAGLAPRQKADFPPDLQERFGNKRFMPVDPPIFLDYPGAELMLMGTGMELKEELGIELNPENETLHSAEVFTDLRLDKTAATIDPLFKGKWI